jgi:hypothetical protein
MAKRTRIIRTKVKVAECHHWFDPKFPTIQDIPGYCVGRCEICKCIIALEEKKG